MAPSHSEVEIKPVPMVYLIVAVLMVMMILVPPSLRLVCTLKQPQCNSSLLIADLKKLFVMQVVHLLV